MKIQIGLDPTKLKPYYHSCILWNVPISPLEISGLPTKQQQKNYLSSCELTQAHRTFQT